MDDLTVIMDSDIGTFLRRYTRLIPAIAQDAGIGAEDVYSVLYQTIENGESLVSLDYGTRQVIEMMALPRRKRTAEVLHRWRLLADPEYGRDEDMEWIGGR